MRNKVFVALSGGVDSSVAAALLKSAYVDLHGRVRIAEGRRPEARHSHAGFDVVGIHMAMWSEPGAACSAAEDRRDAARVAAHLGIPFQTWDFTEEYRNAVVDYLVREYAVGRTPNPDVMCNREIKFGVFLRRALESGADYIATGHYVRLRKSGEWGVGSGQKQRTGLHTLHSALDTRKDQSYFLWTLGQRELARCLFPIGELAKPEVRSIARRLGLPTADKPDSQGICFIGEVSMRDFLSRRLPERSGLVLTTGGRVIGEHAGAEFYTIGQRRGIAIGGGQPYFVAERNLSANTLVVAEGRDDPALYRRELSAGDINWISGAEPRFPLRCEARIRYRQPLQNCTVERPLPNAQCRVTFGKPQRAVTPGQSVVFYQAGEMLGGGVIN